MPHPLVREYFGEQLRSERPEAWKECKADRYRISRKVLNGKDLGHGERESHKKSHNTSKSVEFRYLASKSNESSHDNSQPRHDPTLRLAMSDPTQLRGRISDRCGLRKLHR